MRRTRILVLAPIVLGLFHSAGRVAEGDFTLYTLVTFDGSNGSRPFSGVTLDSQGNLYGATGGGGAYGLGSVYEVAAGTRAFSTIASFDSSTTSGFRSGVALDAQDNIYGTTEYGGINGAGSVYEVAAGSHAVSTIASLSGTDGSIPGSGVTIDAQGNLYGTASQGGSNLGIYQGAGTVYKVAAGSHALSVLAYLGGTNGNTPFAGLTLDGQGNLYGATNSGGANSAGAAFEVAAGTHALSTIATFDYNTSGGSPYSRMVIDAQGNLYGTTPQGGAHNAGTIFEVAAGTHTLSTIASFNGTDGSFAYGGLAIDARGNLFGAAEAGGAYNSGAVFEVVAGTHTITTIASFNGHNGSAPLGDLVVDAMGNIYGTTYQGGDHNFGTVFELTSVPEPASVVILGQAAGIVGLGLAARARSLRARGR